MNDIYKESLEFHKKNKGKIEIKSKASLDNKEVLSLAYTPGVAEVSRAIAQNPESVYEYTLKQNTVAVVSDGSAILGLGNLGAKAAIPVMEGKAAIFKEFAGVDAFPVCLDTQDTEEIIKIVKAISPVFGAINLEDIAAPRCFEIERRLQAELDIPVMHDDQHGTAVVVLAGLINALKVRGSKKEEVKILINGAGAAGSAIANILNQYGFEEILICDSKGLLGKSRDDLNEEKIELLKFVNKKNLEGALEDGIVGVDIFIGVSKAGLLTEELITKMNPKPIIFALANPVPEIMPDIAQKAGAFVVATGRSDFPNQVNNAYCFPGLFRGALDNHIKQFTPEMFVKAAEALADCEKNPTQEKILPNLFDPEVAKAISRTIV